MIFKVYYQESPTEIPVRENTKSLYMEADEEKDVRNKLVNRNYNIEFIQPLDEAHLNYEKQSEHFTLENA
ncbi:DNA-dependent RNA polymerase subunit epsilon [Virgibacillus siamensis]|uniref:DNA-dependent RNA polymerase subunit epsilon n=1 Tax=Virgibacillus siamensis TaxID=480071 RepID=UPI0009842CA0|nr:DNA-directed RNA polymerase subunit epsilon [Virgibacillus siamensis]